MIEIIGEKTRKPYQIFDLSGAKSLLTLLQEHGIIVSAPCNGKGACGRCRVRFVMGAPMPTEADACLLRQEELNAGVRLACAVHITHPCQISIEEFGEEHMAVLTQTEAKEMGIRTGFIPDETIGCEKSAAALDAGENGAYGIAIDIGTTTLAAELIDLADGRRIAVASGINHQRAYGADVITRISASNEGKGALLQASIRRDIVNLMDKLLAQASEACKNQHNHGDENIEKAQIQREDIAQIAIVGNTTMCHLLRGLSCEGLGRAPFTPMDNALYETSAGELLSMDDWQARVTILPGISAFVGSDIVAGIFASGMNKCEGAALLLDIGTNGEMVLAKNGELLVTSAAAGPVFEGGNITYGMPSVTGAISHAALASELCSATASKPEWWCETIGDCAPTGICGTGIIDIVSELTHAGMMDENGTLAEPWFTEGVKVAGNITFAQRDIRQVQMGKAAIRAGIEILLSEYDVTDNLTGKFVEDAQATHYQMSQQFTVYLAGGFGQQIDVKKAIHIGMFPKEFKDCTRCIGNSALAGAKQYLLSPETAGTQIDDLIAHAKEINLAKHPRFEEIYLQYMDF